MKILVILLLLLVSACRYPQDICTYENAQVVSKGSSERGTLKWLKLRHKNEITWAVYVTDYDWNKYEVGQYINCRLDTIINN